MLDVVLMCEGTYPYVPGGVSSWIHALITGMPEFKFGIVYIAPTRDLTREFKFPVPDNVVDLVEIYIYDTVEWPQKVARGSKDAAWKSVASFLGGVTEGKSQDFLGFLQHVRGTDDHPATLAFQDLVYSKKCWDIAVDLYRRKMGNSSFLDFFWNWRFAHIPLFQLMYAEIPQGRVYHTITTGWSGMLGRHRQGGPPASSHPHGARDLHQRAAHRDRPRPTGSSSIGPRARPIPGRTRSRRCG